MGLAQSFRAAVEQFSGLDDYYDEYDEYDDEESGDPAGSAQFDDPSRPLALVRPRRIEFSLVAPTEYDDAQRIAAGLRAGAPVVVDLQGCGADLRTRLIDFCSGLTYALDGELEFVGEHVVLLAPSGVGLSSATAGFGRARRFYNQV